MALATRTIESYSNCFDQIEKACQAIQQGNATKAADILCSVRDDAIMLNKQSKIYYEGLRRLEVQQNIQLEILMKQVNDLYQQEQKCKQQERELDTKKKVLARRKESEEESYRNAERRYREARDERDKAQEKVDDLKKWWWVPIYGLSLAIEELLQNNDQKARDADRDMDCHRNRSRDAQQEIDSLSTDIIKVHREMRDTSKRKSELNQKRDTVHDQLGATKNTAVLLLEASQFWDDISSLSDSASLKTDRVEKILSFAASLKKNQEKILKSRGTKTLVGSFKDCWVEIEDMITGNNLVFAEDSLAEVEALMSNHLMIVRDDDLGEVFHFVDQSPESIIITHYVMLMNVLLLSSFLINWGAIFVSIFFMIYYILSFPLWVIVKIIVAVMSVLFSILYCFISFVLSAIIVVFIVAAFIWHVLCCLFFLVNRKINDPQNEILT